MPSLIEELQRDSLNQQASVTQLVQKCLVVATKLGIDEFANWSRLELDGYKEAEVPGYRVVRGQPQVFNPYRGHQPLHFGDLKQAERLSEMNFNQPIGELEHELRHAEKTGLGDFQVLYPPAVEKLLRNAIRFNLQPSLNVNASQFRRILDAVRKAVLEWSLRLESDGITGEGMSFSREEKETAQSTTYHIKNFFQGNVDRSQIQIEAVSTTQSQSTLELNISRLRDVVKVLKVSVDELPLSAELKAELLAEIQTLESQSNSPKPKESILRESLDSVRRILEGAAGSLVASGLLNQINALFGL
ncbi:MAG: hypothetical protein H7X91_06090 [Burkholderiales bacterium]|nr:hypothetical protein [Burkholderiales bacterium]